MMPGFQIQTTSPDRFLTDFASVINTEEPSKAGAWLLQNAVNMSEDMFNNVDLVTIHELGPLGMILLRTATPNIKIFSAERKSDFNKLVSGDAELTALADYAYSTTDYSFVQRVPDEIRPLIITFMDTVYRAKLRPVDLRVLNSR